MIFKQITFKVDVPVTVDWGDGNLQNYSAGIVSGLPSGEVVITSTYPVEGIEFLSDTIAQASFDNAKDFKYADELFKGKDNIQVVYFDKESPIRTTRQAFTDSGIIYHADMSYHKPQQLQYMHLRAKKLQCVEGLDTTNAFDAYGIFRDTPNLQHPRPFEIKALENTNDGGCHYENTYQCVYPIYHNDKIINTVNMLISFPSTYNVPDDFEIYFKFTEDLNPSYPKKHRHTYYGHTHIDTINKHLVLDGSGDYVLSYFSSLQDRGSGSAWIYRRAAGRNYDVVFADDTSTNRCILWIPTDNKLYFQLDSSTKGVCNTTTTTIPTNTWTHVGVTYDENSVRLFINGVVVGGVDNVATVGNFWQDVRSWMTIGGGGAVTDAYMFMKHVRWYDRKLYDGEMKAIYAKGV